MISAVETPCEPRPGDRAEPPLQEPGSELAWGWVGVRSARGTAADGSPKKSNDTDLDPRVHGEFRDRSAGPQASKPGLGMPPIFDVGHRFGGWADAGGHGLESVPFVEAPVAVVLLEGVKAQASGMERLGVLEGAGSQTLPLLRGST